jgi:hypothetical protein
MRTDKIYDCDFNCGFTIDIGDEYREGYDEDDMQTTVIRIHDQCYRLFIAFGGDPFEENEDEISEFLKNILFKTDQEAQMFRESYIKPEDDKYYIWILRVIEDGVTPFNMNTKTTKAWDDWCNWRVFRFRKTKEE